MFLVGRVPTKHQKFLESMILNSKRVANNYDGSDSGGSLGLLVNENQEVEVEVAGVVSCASAA